MNDLRELAGQARRNGNYRAGVALDRAADVLDEAERPHRAGTSTPDSGTGHLDQLQAHVRGLTKPIQERPRPAAH